MNIAVLNFSPNVGKTTIAKNLLLPRLPLNYIAIESINDNADIYRTDCIIMANDYPKLQEKLQIEGNLLIDIGSSNVEQVLNYLSKYVESHEYFNYFVIPMTFDIKSRIETQRTLLALLKLGISTDKIRLIFNKSTMEEDLFIVEFKEAIHIADIFNIERPTIAIQDNSIYSLLRANHLNMQIVLEAINRKKGKLYNTSSNLQDLINGTIEAKKNLDSVFAQLKI